MPQLAYRQPLSMARLAPIVVLEASHRVTQRGNRRLETSFDDDDDRANHDLLAAAGHESREYGRNHGWSRSGSIVRVCVEQLQAAMSR